MIKKIHTEDLPDSWELVPLGEFVENEKGKKPKQESKEKSPEFNLPYIDIQAFEEGIIKSWTNGEGCRLCYEDDFLMVWDGSRSGLVGKGVNGALGSTLVRINFPGIFNDYAYYFLQSKFAEINSRAKGVGIPHVDPNLLWNYGFPIPPLNEQKRIVAKIEELFSELDSGIESLKTAREQLKVYRQAVLKHAFEGKLTAPWREKNKDKLESAEQLLKRIIPGSKKPQVVTEEEQSKLLALPETWQYARLAEIATIGSGMSVSKDRKVNDPVEVPYLRVANVQRGKLSLEEIKTMRIEKARLPDLELKQWDVLFNEGGDRDKLGRGWIWESQITPCITQNHVFRATTVLGLDFHAKFISHWGNSFGQAYFDTEGKQTTNLASINKGVLSRFPIPFPPLDEQAEIIRILEAQFSIIENLENTIDAELQKSEALRQSILKKAFCGQLVAQDPADEPASLLLERIRSEKATSKPTAKKPKEKRRAA